MNHDDENESRFCVEEDKASVDPVTKCFGIVTKGRCALGQKLVGVRNQPRWKSTISEKTDKENISM